MGLPPVPGPRPRADLGRVPATPCRCSRWSQLPCAAGEHRRTATPTLSSTPALSTDLNPTSSSPPQKAGGAPAAAAAGAPVFTNAALDPAHDPDAPELKAQKSVTVKEARKKQSLLNELLKECSKILRALTSRERLAFPFMQPVDPARDGIPDYFAVVKAPMDFGTVASRLKTKAYDTPEGFRDDVRQIFQNCRLYNTAPGSEIREKCERLSEAFELKWADSLIETHWTAGAIAPVERTSLAKLKEHAKIRRSKSVVIDEAMESIWGLCARILKQVKDHKR